MSILKSATTSRVGRVGVALGVIAAAAVTFAAPSSAAVTTATLSPTTGPSGAAGTIANVVGTGFASATGSSLTGTVQFNQAATCPATAPSAGATVIAVATKTVVSATRLVVTVPSLPLATGATSTVYQLCVYTSASGNALIDSGKYTVYPAPTYAVSSAVTPVTYSSMGGGTLTVSGTNFSAKTTATLGGTAVTNIKVAPAGTSFTATIPAHAASSTAVDLVVTTEGGSVTKSAVFTYVNGITVSPNWVASGATGVIDVKGVGFNAVFAAANTHAGVDLSQDGAYDGAAGTNFHCGTVQVISDTELVCTVPSTMADGAYTVYVTDDNTSATPTTVSVISSGASVTVAGF